MHVNQYLKDYLKNIPKKIGWTTVILALAFGIYKGFYSIHSLYHLNQAAFIKDPYIKMIISILVGLLNAIAFLSGTLWFVFVRSLKDKIDDRQFSMLTKMAIVALSVSTVAAFMEWGAIPWDSILFPGYYFFVFLYFWYYVNKLLIRQRLN